MKIKFYSLLHGTKNAPDQELRFILCRQLSMKSKTMRTTQIFQKLAAVVIAVLLAITNAVAGDATINGTMTNSGSFIIKSALAGSVKDIGGTVAFAKNGDQTIPAGYTFEKLECTTGGTKTFAGMVTITDYIKADAAAVTIGTKRLKVTSGSANAVQVANAGSVDFTSGDVEYARDGIQTIYGTTYKNLITSGATGAVIKSTAGFVTVSGSLTNGDNTTLDFGTYSFKATGAAIHNLTILKSSGTVTVDATAVIDGTFEYAGNAQVVAPASYTNLTLSGGTHSFNGITKVAGVYLPGGGERTYTGTFEYNGSGYGQSVAGEANYANVGLSGGNPKKLAGEISVSGDLTLAENTPLTAENFNIYLAGNLVLGSNITTGSGVLFMTSPIATNVTGSYEVIGAVNRNHSFASNTAYAFNRTEITLSVASNADLNVTLTDIVSTAPSSGSGLGSKYINRQYKIAGANFSGNAATLRLYYTDAEKVGSFDENRLVLKKLRSGVWSSLAKGSYTRNISGDPNDITLAGLTENFTSQTELGMIISGFVTINNGVWNIAGTWDGGDIPSAIDDAEIRHAVTMGGADHTIASLTIVKDVSYSGTMTVDSHILNAGSVTNYGTFSVENGAAANLAGDFANEAGAQLNTNGTGSLTITGAKLYNYGSIGNAGRITVR
jgi:fibronectin-binding autotransporter adhesin